MSAHPLAITPIEVQKAIREERKGWSAQYSEIRHYIFKEPKCPVCEEPFLNLREGWLHSNVTSEIFWARAYLRAIPKIHPQILHIRPMPEEELLSEKKKCPLCTLTVRWTEQEGGVEWLQKRNRAKDAWEKVRAMKELHIQVDPERKEEEEKKAKELRRINGTAEK